MPSFTVNSGVPDTTAKSVGNNDTGSIAVGGTLSDTTDIIWTGGSASPGVIIDNSGTISATTRGIDTSGAFTTGSFTLTNHVGAKLVSSNNDAFRINTNIATGTITVDNSGFIVSGALDAAGHIVAHASGQALDFAAITSSTAIIDIVNHAGAAIGASGDDAIRPGAGNITISNDGLIDATASSSRAINLNTSNLSNITSFQLENGADGTIQSTGDAVRITAATLSPTATGTFVIDNAGTIQSTGTTSRTNGQAIDFNDLRSPLGHVTITNEATGLIQAADADAIRPGTNATINNHGRIIANSVAGDTGNDAIDFQANTGGAVHNFAGGSITGARHGITGDSPTTVTNDAGATITGNAGSGINLDTASNTTTTITNRGAISGTSNGTTDGDGIDVDGLIALDNYGSIQAFGHTDGELAEAVTVGGGTINNFVGGLLQSSERAITVDDSNLGNAFAPTVIYNEGTIAGGNGQAISITDTFADTITNNGAIVGSIAMGGGDDVFNEYTGSSVSGAIDGGDGTDTVNLLGAGTGTLADVVNFEALNVQGGVWTVTDDESFSAGTTIANGAQLHLGNGAAAGSLSGAVTDNGLFEVDRSDSFNFNFLISGTGVLEQDGTGTTVLSQSNTYSGGTTIDAGTLDLAALGAAGTGDIAFAAGAQTLRIEQAALNHGHLDNTIDGFGAGDTIDLAGIGLARQATLSANNVLTITGGSSGSITLQLDAHAYGSGEHFQLASDGHGGTNVSVVFDNLVQGNSGDNILVAKLLSSNGSFIDGRAGNDILIGGLHADVLNGGAGNDFLYAGAGADQFRFNGFDVAAGRHDTDTVFDLNFAKGDSLVLYDYQAGTFASAGSGKGEHGTVNLVDTGEGKGSGAIVTSMSALVDLIKESPDVTAHHALFTDSLTVDIGQSNGSHETIVLDHQWHAYLAAGGDLLI